jgi:signal transduction histidine kinase
VAETQTLQFQKMLLRRKLIVAGVVVLIFVFLLLRNVASYAFVRQIGEQLESSLDARLETSAGLITNVINGAVNNLYDPIDLQLLPFTLARVRNSSDLEAVYLIDRDVNVLVDSDPDRPSRGYILKDSLDIRTAWKNGSATSSIHTFSGAHFKNAYVVLEDFSGNSALLVVEANAGFFSILNFYYKSLYLNSAIAAAVFIVLTVFLVMATTKFLRTEERLQESQRLAAMGQMTATMAHEIRNPLGIIKASTDVLREKYQSEGEQDELFGFVDDEIKRLSRLVSDFLAFSREPILNAHPADINVIIRDAIIAFTSEKEINIEFSPKQEELRTHVDSDKLYQVLLNLLLNAWQAMDGNGAIRIKTREIRQRGVTYAEIIVQDDGPGFHGDLSKVFEPFYTTKTQGTGLGLAVCRTIIEKMDGLIRADNIPGGGARIVLQLPIRID